MDDPHLQHVSRQAAARGRSPGWRVASPRGPERLFADTEHGSTGTALDAALAWRDAQLDVRQHVPIPKGRVTLAPGLYLGTQTVRGRVYPVVKASADDAQGKRHVLSRSLFKHTPEDAIREAAELRFRARHGRPGFPHDSAQSLFDEAFAVYQAYAEAHPPEGTA